MRYLASPYSHEDPFIREERYLRAMKVLSSLLLVGQYVYSPIVHCHELAKVANLPKTADFWRRYNFHMLAQCEDLLILRIDGWESSVGIAEEKAEAERLNLPVSYL